LAEGQGTANVEQSEAKQLPKENADTCDITKPPTFHIPAYIRHNRNLNKRDAD